MVSLLNKKINGTSRDCKFPNAYAFRSFPKGCGRHSSIDSTSKGNKDPPPMSVINPIKDIVMVDDSYGNNNSLGFHQEANAGYVHRDAILFLDAWLLKNAKRKGLSSLYMNKDCDLKVMWNSRSDHHNCSERTRPRDKSIEFHLPSSEVYYKSQNDVPLSSVKLKKNVEGIEVSSCIGNKNQGDEKVVKSREIENRSIISREFYERSRNVFDMTQNTRVPCSSVMQERKVEKSNSLMAITNEDDDEKETLKIQDRVRRISLGHHQESGNNNYFNYKSITPLQTINFMKSKALSFNVNDNEYYDRKRVISTRDVSLSHDDYKVRKALDLFHEIYAKANEEQVTKSKLFFGNSNIKVHTKAAMILRRKCGWVNTSKRLGHVPGIEIGDKFQWMTELNIIGLHRQFMNGIDYMDKDGIKVATSIVAADRYSNHIQSANTLIYSGQGGFSRKETTRDQKLVRGNLALKNSMETRSPVRVILGVKNLPSSFVTIGKNGRKLTNSFYVYDGLYYVENCWQKRDESGKLVFMFCMKRIPGQPELASQWAKYKPKKC